MESCTVGKNGGEQVKVCTVVTVWKCPWFLLGGVGGCRSIAE